MTIEQLEMVARRIRNIRNPFEDYAQSAEGHARDYRAGRTTFAECEERINFEEFKALSLAGKLAAARLAEQPPADWLAELDNRRQLASAGIKPPASASECAKLAAELATRRQAARLAERCAELAKAPTIIPGAGIVQSLQELAAYRAELAEFRGPLAKLAAELGKEQPAAIFAELAARLAELAAS